jgi:ArsR family transcriptional regulator
VGNSVPRSEGEASGCNSPPRIFALTYVLRRLYWCVVKLISIYKCLCDETRLRILNLLLVSPLCVCHLQEILDKPQVKISQHLAYLKQRGMVNCQRHQQWMIYSLPTEQPAELEANLKCLQDCVQTEPAFKADRAKLKRLMGSKTVRTLLEEGCCFQPAETCAPKRKGTL